jgi:hypothetical protein
MENATLKTLTLNFFKYIVENPNETVKFYKALAPHVLKRLVLSDALSSKKNTVFEMILSL